MNGTAARTATGARSLLSRAFTGPGGVTRAASAAVLIGTLAAQHPNPVFNRAQRLDMFSALFPNWRFFAPTPAQHDYHFLYRTLNHEGETSPWRMVEVIAGRKLPQIFWFPGRRPEKAVFDICTELISSLDKGFDHVVKLPAYRLLRDRIQRDALAADNAAGDVKGFQFTLVRATGYDESTEPEVIFVSPYTAMTDSVRPSRPSHDFHIRDDSTDERPAAPAR
ncbi:MAG: hypothetical protein ACRDP3_15235 [Streptomyces sp.]|uniref:hypothetical protein n=1 Tax=Streptomyces sp. TaxID=1931 RepID=UPI003D6AA42C